MRRYPRSSCVASCSPLRRARAARRIGARRPARAPAGDAVVRARQGQLPRRRLRRRAATPLKHALGVGARNDAEIRELAGAHRARAARLRRGAAADRGARLDRGARHPRAAPTGSRATSSTRPTSSRRCSPTRRSRTPGRATSRGSRAAGSGRHPFEMEGGIGRRGRDAARARPRAARRGQRGPVRARRRAHPGARRDGLERGARSTRTRGTSRRGSTCGSTASR